ncbi:MAG: CheR family methyltransferase [Pantoea sp.]|uniref:Chemotaxis protein methyltransferase n=1 Tax=Pantoea septica TaxID=472695 RepID=A0ABX3UVX6_9GAMM|nr:MULTISPECIES: CheR family methyltransferase [Pantoea]MDU5781163.1 CheR family methyltransferase [Pantoea sp.]ORN02597.1 chemotaxis protein-glutamate O-methyltransferase [Pantoea septica]
MFNRYHNPVEPEYTSRFTKHSLSDQELAKVSRLIYQRAGIVLTSQKRDMVVNRLSRRLRDLNLSDFNEYIALLEAHPTGEEWQTFINALTTNLTSFFREAYHFPVLAEHARLRAAGYCVWCNAASTGEEAYSIAMTLEESLGPNNIGPRVWATDIDTAVLGKAQMGIYRLADIDCLTKDQKKNHFLRGTGINQDRVRVKQSLRSAVHFKQLNLLDCSWDVPAPFDAIFCRNVMIYFDRKTQQQLLTRFAKMLKPGGLLFVGHSENFVHLASPFRLRGQSVYALEAKNR